MTHPEELLAGYVDGTLSAKDRAAVDAHIAECPRCRRETTLAASAPSIAGSARAARCGGCARRMDERRVTSDE